MPGGLAGSKAMAESALVGEILKHFEKNDKYIAAICAAPTALLKHSIGIGKHITSYPSFKDQLSEKYQYNDVDIVVQDGKLITSRGPYTAFPFALKICENLVFTFPN
jgi:protein DJ-1